jgi:molybdopterin biosynthesis enzyme MoaB
MIRTAIIALETDGDQESAALQAIRAVLSQGDFTEVDYQRVPAAQAMIRAKLRMIADTDAADLILTLGGISLDIKDRMPEATEEVIERSTAGIAELVRFALLKHSRKAALYRNIAGIRRRTLIINLPSDEKGVQVACATIVSILPDAIASINYETLL